MQEVNRES
jgi:hypothetical protein